MGQSLVNCPSDRSYSPPLEASRGLLKEWVARKSGLPRETREKTRFHMPRKGYRSKLKLFPRLLASIAGPEFTAERSG